MKMYCPDIDHFIKLDPENRPKHLMVEEDDANRNQMHHHLYEKTKTERKKNTFRIVDFPESPEPNNKT